MKKGNKPTRGPQRRGARRAPPGRGPRSARAAFPQESSSGGDLDRHFEGRARLAQLLARAGSDVPPDAVAEGFKQAQADRLAAADVIPALFEGEPRFQKADDARALYSNLLGLWDLLARGEEVDLAAPPPREKPPRPPPVEPPPPFAGAPDAAWVEAAWRALEACPGKELTRLLHAFDNRQDALVRWLEQAFEVESARGPLSDEAFGVARDICFELFALLHRGRAGGWPAVRAELLEGPPPPPAPPALGAYAEELVFDAETDEDRKLSGREAEVVRALVGRALAALWAAGAPGRPGT